MAYNGFHGGSFHALAWPLPFDDAALQAQHELLSGGWAKEPALGSLVSSPAAVLTACGVHEAALMDEMASSLGGVCDGLGGGGVPSPPSSRYASCYNTPVGSPCKAAQAPPVTSLLAAADTMIAERAARLSYLAVDGPGCGKLSRVASSKSLLAEPATASAAAGGVHLLPASDGSGSDAPCRKRKTPRAKAKGKEGATATTTIAKSPEPGRKAKKCKPSSDAAGDEDTKPIACKAGHGGNGKGKDLAGEPPKDCIHVRARRGQATDSHSLAERVRREKISERMKLLQDLVPGCNKVTGKAVMLDEIINYVQSLQRQVEFLSMKLSTVNPQLDFDVDNFIPKDASEPSLPAPLSLPPPQPPLSYSPEGASPAICYASSQGTAMQSVVTSTKPFQKAPTFANHHVIPVPSVDGFDNANSQAGSCMWEDDLQSMVQMGFRGNT